MFRLYEWNFSSTIEMVSGGLLMATLIVIISAL